MSIESPKEEQDDGALAAMQDTLESEQIAFVDTLDEEIKTVVEQASTLQRYDYVIGTVDDVWTSSNDFHHFDLIQYNEEADGDNLIHCVIHPSRRPSITTDITEGRQLAVAGNVSFYPPEGRASIFVDDVDAVDRDGSSHPFERVRTDHRIQIALASMLLLVILVVVSLLAL